MDLKSNFQFILERINVPGRIVLDKPEHTYTCGRAKDNQIVCLSLSVSRRHCIFFHGKDELYVTDLKSSNGLYINGIAQQPYQTTKLRSNDIIGIGCPDVNSTDRTMFRYKLRITAESSATVNDNSSSALSETVLNVEHTCNDKLNTISKRKRDKKNRDAKVVPEKIPKLDDRNCVFEMNSFEEQCKVKDENDIEIVHVSLNCSTARVNNSYINITKHCDTSNMWNANKHTDMFGSNNIVTNANLQCSTDDNVESDLFRSTANSDSLVSSEKKENVVGKGSSIISNSKKESNTDPLRNNEKQSDSNIESNESVQTAASGRTNYNTESKNTAEHNGTNVNCHLVRVEEPGNTFSNLEKTKEILDRVETAAEDVSALPMNILQNADGLIKFEEELQLTDTDEDAIIYSLNGNSMPLVSPIKLKKLNQEPKTKFSVDDVVNISDNEDDVFPCSQLFDIAFGTNTSVKDEIKEEPIETVNERYSILDDADLIISLTDSEDEDNNWLHRLSRSQILNETDEINGSISDEKVKSEDMDVEIVDVKEPPVDESLKKTVAPEKEEGTPPRDARNSCKATSTDIFADEIEIESEDLIEQTSSREIVNTTASSGAKVYESPDYDTVLMGQKGSDNSMNISSNSKIETPPFLKKKRSLEKKVPQIEPPHLPTRRRSSVTGKAKPADKAEKPARQKLSAKEKKELQQKLKLEQYLHEKEQRNRKMLHKWADCLPASKIKQSNLTKEEKKVLADSRKVKLKKLALEEKRASLENSIEKKRIASKPKAKVTTKTRNDFLVEETISASKSEDSVEKSKPSSSRAASASSSPSNFKANSSATETAKGKDVSKEISAHLQNKLTLNDISNLGKIPKKSGAAKAKENTAAAEQALNNLSLGIQVANGETVQSKNAELKSRSSTEPPKPVEREHSVPLRSNVKSSLAKVKKKRVSFSQNIQTVREYEIDESNVLKKLTGKDAPIPADKVAVNRPKNISGASNDKFNEFLWRIFLWNPVWLEEQEYLNTTAPVVRSDELNVMLTRYRSYEEYYKVISPLLLLEIWYGITNEFQNIDQNYRRPTFMCSIVENSVQTGLSATNVRFSTLMLEVLVTKEDMCKKTPPIYGDLIFFEYVKNHENKQFFHKVFAYVTNVYTTVLTPLTRYNRELKNYVKNPRTLLTYTVTTRELNKNISVNRVQRLRTVSYLRPSLRMVQALQYLPNSPLANLIVNPKIDMYKLPDVSGSVAMVTGDKLNKKQMEAVCKVTKSVAQKDTKLCFIQGPPGTGKSKVIVNIVTQILYGNNRYTNNGSPVKILVCAPSNAAIDEIVLRLLDVRLSIKQEAKLKPFKMVRIGRAEMMHPTVRNISVTELAKRDIKKTTATTNSIPTDSVENEMLLLDSKMNALKCELANSRSVDDTYKQHLRMKLSEVEAKKELLKNRTPLNEINEKERMKLQRGTENRLLEYADIITCTLSSCYTNQMESIFGANKKRISVCIVDEATQSCEAETLIPLMLGVGMLVLVGDDNQLPATILSPQAKKLGLGQSIFSRVQNAFEMQPANPIIMLDTQYRMQPDISSWANKFFYGGKLNNAIPRNNQFPFHAYRLLNVNTCENNDNFVNNGEANLVANIIYCMLSFANLDNWESCITYGILTPYNNQKSAILTKINEKTSSLPENIKKKMKIDVNTVDGFQGQERDVIIMSCVRSQRIGFMSDRQRLCVALTRAKHSLIICGNFNIFMKDSMWNSMLSDAKSRRAYFNVNPTANPNEIKSYIIKRMAKK